MEKQFVTYPIALKLKELGFNKECFGWFMPNSLYYDRKCPKSENNLNSEMYNSTVCSAPLWQQAIDWIREKYKLLILIEFSGICLNDSYYSYFIHQNYDCLEYESQTYFSYEIAREHAILKALELIENK
jgi:hypothetical protein